MVMDERRPALASMRPEDTRSTPFLKAPGPSRRHGTDDSAGSCRPPAACRARVRAFAAPPARRRNSWDDTGSSEEGAVTRDGDRTRSREPGRRPPVLARRGRACPDRHREDARGPGPLARSLLFVRSLEDPRGGSRPVDSCPMIPRVSIPLQPGRFRPQTGPPEEILHFALDDPHSLSRTGGTGDPAQMPLRLHQPPRDALPCRTHRALGPVSLHRLPDPPAGYKEHPARTLGPPGDQQQVPTVKLHSFPKQAVDRFPGTQRLVSPRHARART